MPSSRKQSSRRLLDASDASFSFQIPIASPGDDYLLEYDEDFFKGVEDILATPAPSSRSTLEPLTINDLTPRPSTSLKSSPQKIRSRSPANAPPRTPRTSSRIHHGRPKPNSLSHLMDDTSVPQSPAGERIESLKAQLCLLTDELGHAQEPTQQDSLRTAIILKKQKLCRREAAVERKDLSSHNIVLTGGVTSISPATHGPIIVNSPTPVKFDHNLTEPHDVAVDDTDCAAAPESTAVGVVRALSKRPVSSSDEMGVQKKSKLDATLATSGNSKHTTAASSDEQLPVSQRPIRRLPCSSSRLKVNVMEKKAAGKDPVVMRTGNSSSSSKSGSKHCGKDKEQESRTRTTCKPDDSGQHSSGSTTSDHLQNHKESYLQNQNRDHWSKIKSASSSTVPSRPPMTEHARPNSKLKVNMPHATIPIGFNFRVDARLGARKGGESAKMKENDSRPRRQHIFKVSSSSNARHTHPVIPVPMTLQTEVRSKERQKFDERIREKERRDQEERAARMRQREEEEEREIRELRKRTVPRAHEVPDWYKDAPKKGSVRGGPPPS